MQVIALETILDLVTVNPHNLVAWYKVEGSQRLYSYISHAASEKLIVRNPSWCPRSSLMCLGE